MGNLKHVLFTNKVQGKSAIKTTVQMENGISNFNVVKNISDVFIFQGLSAWEGWRRQINVLIRLTKRNNELNYVSCLPRCCCCFNDTDS